MAWLSTHQTKLPQSLLVLGVLLICSWPIASACAQSRASTALQSVDFKTVTIQLKDQNDQPIKGARISIPRPKNTPVDGQTDKDGLFVSEPERTFTLGRGEYKLQITSPQLPGGPANIPLPDDKLLEAFSKTGALVVNVKLDKNGNLLVTFGNVGSQPSLSAKALTLPVVVTDENHRPIPNARVVISQATTVGGQGETEEYTGPDGMQPIMV